MTITVHLPLAVKQRLAHYCVERKISKSVALRRALDHLLNPAVHASPYSLGTDLFGTSANCKRDSVDVARHTKRLLRSSTRRSKKLPFAS